MHVGALKEALLAGLLARLRAGQTTAAAKVWAEAGGLTVQGWQAGVDTAGQSGVSGLAGQ